MYLYFVSGLILSWISPLNKNINNSNNNHVITSKQNFTKVKTLKAYSSTKFVKVYKKPILSKTNVNKADNENSLNLSAIIPTVVLGGLGFGIGVIIGGFIGFKLFKNTVFDVEPIQGFRERVPNYFNFPNDELTAEYEGSSEILSNSEIVESQAEIHASNELYVSDENNSSEFDLSWSQEFNDTQEKETVVQNKKETVVQNNNKKLSEKELNRREILLNSLLAYEKTKFGTLTRNSSNIENTKFYCDHNGFSTYGISFFSREYGFTNFGKYTYSKVIIDDDGRYYSRTGIGFYNQPNKLYKIILGTLSFGVGTGILASFFSGAITYGVTAQ